MAVPVSPALSTPKMCTRKPFNAVEASTWSVTQNGPVNRACICGGRHYGGGGRHYGGGAVRRNYGYRGGGRNYGRLSPQFLIFESGDLGR